MTTLKKIRAEIERLQTYVFSSRDTKKVELADVLDVIDKYAEQEPTSPCDLCQFDYVDGVCGDCPAMAKRKS